MGLSTHSPAVTEGALLHFKPHLLSREGRRFAVSRGTDREKELGSVKATRARNVEMECIVVIYIIVQWKSSKAQN